MIVQCASCGASNRVPVTKMSLRARCGQCKTPLGPPSEPMAIGSEAEFDELVRDAPVPVVADFWAAWCGPCRMVAPELEKLARDRRGEALVVKVDTEKLPGLAARFGIRSIPTMIAFRRGRESKRVSGALPAQQIASTLLM